MPKTGSVSKVREEVLMKYIMQFMKCINTNYAVNKILGSSVILQFLLRAGIISIDHHLLYENGESSEKVMQ